MRFSKVAISSVAAIVDGNAQAAGRTCRVDPHHDIKRQAAPLRIRGAGVSGPRVSVVLTGLTRYER
jgi:hypothetical protein